MSYSYWTTCPNPSMDCTNMVLVQVDADGVERGECGECGYAWVDEPEEKEEEDVRPV